jgi:FtsZ-binding cell division protein ZapB
METTNEKLKEIIEKIKERNNTIQQEKQDKQTNQEIKNYLTKLNINTL